MAHTTTSTTAEPTVQERITARAFAQMVAMIHVANQREDKQTGDPKVGGHPASCASSMHVLAALHLEVREPQDWVCCKPHASPVDHTLHHLLGLFRHDPAVDWFDGPGDGSRFSDEESENAMWGLRQFPSKERPQTFQSYHAATDPDHWHFLPSGTVGIPPVCSGYLALAHRYAQDHGWEVPEDAHFWSLIGDSEFREGSLLEAMPDFGERMLGNVTWIVDYNRQNLDGTRIPNERGLKSMDCDRIEETARANGWKVIQLRHGRLREELFEREGGDCLREVLERGLSDYEFQMLVLKRDPDRIRRLWKEKCPGIEALLDEMEDEEVLRVLLDLGGHDYAKVVEALRSSKEDPEEPYVLIAHTFKGWGLDCIADPANHSTLPPEEEVQRLLAEHGLDLERPFRRFDESSEEGAFLKERREAFLEAREEHDELARRNREKVSQAIEEVGGVPDTFDIDLSMFPVIHTQWMWGQIAAKLVRIGSYSQAEAREAPQKELSEDEKRWAPSAEHVMTMSPDVGSSTNISPTMDDRVYGTSQEEQRDLRRELEIKVKHPELLAHTDPWTRHIRFEIAEANCMSAMGAFGKMGAYVGLPFTPIMTVYDFFVKRALDQLYYDVYWGAEFILMGTPSGVTLSPEGAQHSWKSDIQMPNLVTWEPAFAIEMDWIFCDAIRRRMEGRNEGRQGVYVRAVTRGIPQKLMLERVRAQPGNQDRDDDELLAGVREHCLAGAWKLIDRSGEEGYEPGDNVVNVFVMGAPVTEAVAASDQLLERGVFADVIVVSSQDLLLGIQAHEDGDRHLRETLGVTGDLHAVEGTGESEAGLVSIAGRRVPAVAVCDGESGLLDNIGSVVGVQQVTLGVRKFSKCGRPADVYGYQHLDADSIALACGEVLSRTALEDLRVDRDLLERMAGRSEREKPDWRELWPEG